MFVINEHACHYYVTCSTRVRFPSCSGRGAKTRDRILKTVHLNRARTKRVIFREKIRERTRSRLIVGFDYVEIVEQQPRDYAAIIGYNRETRGSGLKASNADARNRFAPR